ncbi:MAG TPA: DAK2 domain-containing protein [Chthoniobacterales bacterium]|nr:DAK2 domain-containing protein [Chthoniobacterales bacterium]
MPDPDTNEFLQAKLIKVLQQVAEDMIAAEGEFQALDAALGDGDLGVTARMGFQAIRDVCQKSGETQTSDIGNLLSAAGIAFMNANASTMGTLMGTAWLRAGKVAAGKTSLTLGDAVAMCRAAAEGIQRRGKAQLGDKTMLDAIFPACDALAAAAQSGKACVEAFGLAAEAAERGVKETTPLQSQVSRASWLQERSKGLPDPGASLCVRLFQSIANRLGGAGNR